MADYGNIVLDGPVETGRNYTITGEAFKNLLLWRPRPGEGVTVTDSGVRNILRARVLNIGRDRAEVLVYEEAGRLLGPPLEVLLLQALPDKERMELIIQKTTELGVTGIIPIKTAKSISLEERESRQKKAHRWHDVALKAARQSRRHSIPVIHPYADFRDAIEMTGDWGGVRMLLSEKREAVPLKGFLSGGAGGRPAGRAVILSGPEGGFDDAEAGSAREKGFVPVSLGRNILRAETASIIAVGLVLYELGG